MVQGKGWTLERLELDMYYEQVVARTITRDA
jgi:hypothetical protein